ncbi:MAG TPA: hypothetical protein VL576_03245 [Candidatus Paceibacterota bacterium]|jgi:hypothetical protein|nr:hypothetical protein [Candidatus Paceibacterota bacterium]
MKKEQLPTLENEENNEPIIEQDPMKDPQYSEMYNEAQESFYKQQEQEDSEKAKALHADILEHTKDRQLSDTVVTPEGKLEGTSFNASVKEKKPKAYSMKGMRLLAVAALAPILSMLPLHSKAGGTEKGGDKDKDVAKVENVAPTPEPVFHGVTDENKRHWNKYIDYLDSIGLKGSPELNHRAVSEKTMKDFIKKNPGTTFSKDLVVKIQTALKDYQTKLNELEKKAEAKGKTIALRADNGVKGYTFMDDLNKTDTDGFAGQFTTRFKFPGERHTFKKEEYMTGKIPGRDLNVDRLINDPKRTIKNTYKEFAEPTDESTN